MEQRLSDVPEQQWHLSQINVATLRHPLDAPETGEFVAALDEINALAEGSDGFVWRLRDEAGQSSSYVEIPGRASELEIVNYSVWRDFDALRTFMYRTAHVDFLRRRNEWFELSPVLTAACWWLPAGDVDSLAAAYGRLAHLRTHGASDRAWPLRSPRAAPPS